MGRPLLKMLLGALAGLLVWAVMEPSAPKTLESSMWEIWSLNVIMLLGASIGVVLGGFSGWQQGSKLHLVRGLILGALFGWLGARAGMGLGSFLVARTFGSNVFNGGSIVLAVPARIMALTPIGTFIGMGIGASSLNWRRIILGMIGGTIGGGIGAALFDPISSILAQVVITSKGLEGAPAEVGIFGRVAYCILLGAGIGLFIGLVEQVARTAWLRLVLGRNEGKEWVIDSPHVVIGRSETAAVPLFGDSAVAPAHATITRRGQYEYWLTNHSPNGTLLNGQPINDAPLFHGATIQIGGYQLVFLMKAGTAPMKAAEALRSQQHYAIQGQVPAAAPVAPMAYGGAMPGPGGAAAMPLTQQFVAPAPVPAAALTLVAITGPLSGQRYPVNMALDAGREGMGIPLGFDSTASRKHATFSPSPGGIMMNDLGSTNGTFVNDQRIQAAVLSPGDIVRIGVTSFRVE